MTVPTRKEAHDLLDQVLDRGSEQVATATVEFLRAALAWVGPSKVQMLVSGAKTAAKTPGFMEAVRILGGLIEGTASEVPSPSRAGETASRSSHTAENPVRPRSAQPTPYREWCGVGDCPHRAVVTVQGFNYCAEHRRRFLGESDG